MKKVMKVTMKRMQTIFGRREPKNTGDGNSIPHTSDDERFKRDQIEDEPSVSKDRGAFSGDNSTESSPEPIEIFSSSEEDYISRFGDRGVSQVVRVKKSVSNLVKGNTRDGTFVSHVKNVQNENLSPSSPENCGQQVMPYHNQAENSCEGVVLTSCGELEKTCTSLPLELQAKITVIKENLLQQYPPFYDFCIIASDNDYDEAIQFKEYVGSTFGLVGCTLDDGFMSLGADLFECYKKMMDQSTKVFFFVTENFTRDSFCKRIQSGAVFICLMSEAQKDKEKCVPVFPHGFCFPPLALSGIAGLNPTQREATRRSLDNTYSPLLRQRRLVWDQENYKKRCLEFQLQATRCIEEARSERKELCSLKNKLSLMNISMNDDYVVHENSLGPVQEPSSSALQIQFPENSDLSRENVLNNNHMTETSVDNNSSIKTTEHKFESNHSKGDELILPQKMSDENPENGKMKREECDRIASSDEDEDKSGDIGDACDDVLKQFPLPVNHEMTNNTASSVSITDSASVQVGNVYNIVVNQAPSIDISHLEKLIRNTAAFAEKHSSDQHADEKE